MLTDFQKKEYIQHILTLQSIKYLSKKVEVDFLAKQYFYRMKEQDERR